MEGGGRHVASQVPSLGGLDPSSYWTAGSSRRQCHGPGTEPRLTLGLVRSPWQGQMPVALCLCTFKSPNPSILSQGRAPMGEWSPAELGFLSSGVSMTRIPAPVFIPIIIIFFNLLKKKKITEHRDFFFFLKKENQNQTTCPQNVL